MNILLHYNQCFIFVKTSSFQTAFLIAHPSHLGISNSLNTALRVCHWHDFLRHPRVPGCSCAAWGRLLFYPEILPSGL